MTTRKYEVRCCCKPQTVLGYLQLRDGLKHGSVTVVDELPPPVKMPSLREIMEASHPVPVPSVRCQHNIKLLHFSDPSAGIFNQVAVYSDDRPIEFWRNIVGFTEVVAGTGVEPV